MGTPEVFAGANQAAIVSPFFGGGAMAPVFGRRNAGPGSGRGAGRGVIQYYQLIRPGAPVVSPK